MIHHGGTEGTEKKTIKNILILLLRALRASVVQPLLPEIPMSTKLHDFARHAILNTGLTPRTVTSSVNGSAVDLLTGDGRCFALQQVGTVSGTSPTLA